MPDDRPTKEDLQRGITVKIEQTGTNNDDTLVGDVRTILTDEHSHPGGIEVELRSGVTGRITRVAPDE